MPKLFTPRLEILPPAQRALWPRLVQLPQHYVLYGGTAIALQLGHRESEDFDFFCFADDEPAALLDKHMVLMGAEVTQVEPGTLSCRVDGVRLSFFALPKLRPVDEPLRTSDTGLPVASLLDLAGMKAAVVSRRAEVKDYVDLDALFAIGISLEAALGAARAIHGRQFVPHPTLMALSYFDDVPTLPEPARQRLLAAVRAIDPDHLAGQGDGR